MQTPLLRLYVIGRFTIQFNDQTWDKFRTDKGRALLVYLVFAPGQAQRREHLATLLWPDATEAAARSNLRVAIHDLRKRWQRLSGLSADTLLTANRQEVGLVPGAVWCDAAQLLTTWGQCIDHPHVALDDCAECDKRMRAAVEQTTGEVLPSFTLGDAIAFDDWCSWLRIRVEERTISMLETLLQTTIAQRDFNHTIRYARRLLTYLPLHEPYWQQLFHVYTNLRDADRLTTAYADCRQTFQTHMGAEPSAETVAVFEKGYQSLVSVVQMGQGWTQPLSPFFGRSAEIDQLANLLSRPFERLITIAGLGGMGKTRLAIAAAQRVQARFKDGVHFVALADVAATDDVETTLVNEIANTLQLTLNPARDLRQQLLDNLQACHCLFVLDNFEQMVTGSALLLDLLRSAPKIWLLVTSRVPLNFAAETVLNLSGLALPDGDAGLNAGQETPAVALFVQNAQRVHHSFALSDDNWQQIRALCRRLGGVPLAIKLSSALLRSHTLAQLDEQLTASLRVLQTTRSDVPVRHRSILALLETTWRQLSADAQHALVQLTIFRAPYTPASAQWVADLSGSLVDELHDHALLQWATPSRLTLHPLVRQYVSEKAAPTQQTAMRHARHFKQLLLTARASLFGQQPLQAAQVMAVDLPNLAFAWQKWLAEGLIERKTLTTFIRFHQLLGRQHELARLLTMLLEIGRDSADLASLQPYARTIVATHDVFSGKVEKATAHIRQAIEQLEVSGDSADLAHAYVMHGQIQQDNGFPQVARDSYDKALTHALQSDDVRAQVDALSHLNYFLTQTTEHTERAVSLAQQLGDRWLEQKALNRHAISEANAGNYEQAYTTFSILHDLMGDGHQMRLVLLRNMGTALQLLGSYEAALQLHERVSFQANQIINSVMYAHAQIGISAATLALGHPVRALASAENAAAILLKQPSHADKLFAYIALGRAMTANGNVTHAKTTYTTGLEIAETVGLAAFVNLFHAGLINLFLAQSAAGQASSHVDVIWHSTKTTPLNATLSPAFILWQTLQAMITVGDVRVGKFGRYAHNFIQARANAIHDPQRQHHYWERVIRPFSTLFE